VLKLFVLLVENFCIGSDGSGCTTQTLPRLKATFGLFFEVDFNMIIRVIAVAAALAVVTPAFAQQKPVPTPPSAPPAPVGSEPSSTTAAFGDWVLRCQKVEAARACEVGQTINVQGQSQPIAQIAIGRPAPKERLRITIVLPNNVTFGNHVRMGIGEKAEQGLALSWRRCLPMGCFADAELPEDQLRRFRVATEQGRVIFQDGAGREIPLPFSFNGLAQALDALAREG
jgi:invasion protein IalB